jgi:hypothetical protein
MRAPEDLVRRAYEKAKGTDVTHILMIWTSTEYLPDDWIVQVVSTTEELQRKLSTPGGFYQLREVYSMRLPIDEQLAGDQSREAWFVE